MILHFTQGNVTPVLFDNTQKQGLITLLTNVDSFLLERALDVVGNEVGQRRRLDVIARRR